jgi:hypothetical protein
MKPIEIKWDHLNNFKSKKNKHKKHVINDNMNKHSPNKSNFNKKFDDVLDNKNKCVLKKIFKKKKNKIITKINKNVYISSFFILSNKNTKTYKIKVLTK